MKNRNYIKEFLRRTSTKYAPTLEGTIIDPAIRKQLTRQYREWNNARSKLKGELKCNRCKNYFPRDLITKVYTGNGRWWNAYCDECLAKRNPRMARRRYERTTDII